MPTQVQHSIPYFSGIPKDVVTNVFHFSWFGAGDPGPSDYTALSGLVASFYEDIFSAGGATFMAPWMRPALAHQKMYDLTDPIPRVPVFDATVPLTVTQTGTPDIPTEVAACVSVKGDYISGIPLASQRGRVYVGGLGAGCLSNGSSTTFSRLSSTMIANCITAAENMRDNAPVISFRWVVYSPTLGGSMSQITSGWVDNAPDTQRRRGQQADVRTVF